MPASNYTKIFCYFLCLCNTMMLASCTNHAQQDGAPNTTIDVSKIHSPTPHRLAKSRYGNPNSYVINNQRYYVLQNAAGYVKRGIGSWYGTKFDGQRTSSGEPYNMLALTAASRTLPIPVYARVTNLENGRSIIVKVNDRGPFVDVNHRIIDLSYAAAKKLGYANKGTAMVEVSALTFADNPLAPTETMEYLQIASFHNHHNALALKSRLQALTHHPVLIKTNHNQQPPLYRVQIASIANSADSAKLRNLLRNIDIDSIG